MLAFVLSMKLESEILALENPDSGKEQYAPGNSP
jgi:hypothetical protein